MSSSGDDVSVLYVVVSGSGKAHIISFREYVLSRDFWKIVLAGLLQSLQVFLVLHLSSQEVLQGKVSSSV